MKNFYVTAKFQMALPKGVTGVNGGIIMPSKAALHTVERRELDDDYPHLATRFLDPQVYLSTLNAATARSSCARLASWGWFPSTALPSYDSSKQRQADWQRDAEQSIIGGWTGIPPTADADIEDCIRITADVQKRLGCTGIILPSPLTADPHSKFDTEVHWLEAGLEIAGRVTPGMRRYASIALSDSCLRGVDPWNSILLDAVLDQVTAREPEGVYLLIELANEDLYYATDPNTVGAVLRLVDGFKRSGIEDVIVAYVGTVGLMALAAGADGWTSGWYRGERRMRLRDYYSDEGRAYPAYYSHPLAAEFHMDSDLDRTAAGGFLPRVADQTFASAGLLQALQAGKGASAAIEWQYRQTNIEASKQHFLSACVRETAALGALDEQGRLDAVMHWLENAAALANELYAKVGGFNARTSLNHQHSWLAAFQKYVASR